MPKALFGRIDELVRLRQSDDAFAVRGGSVLAGDDVAASPYEVSHGVHRHLDVAIDHLLTIKLLVMGAGAVPTYGAFTVLRAAVENFGSAMWLLSGHDRTERVRRALHFQAADLSASAQAGELVAPAFGGHRRPSASDPSAGGGPVVRGSTVIDDHRPAALRGVAARNGLTMRQVKGGGGWRTIVRSLGTDEGTSNTAEYLWKACSAFAHGDRWPSLAFLDREEMPGSDDKVAHLRLTASFANLTPMLELTLMMAQVVLRTFDRMRLSAG